MADLPTLPMSIEVVDGKITTGHPIEDERLANAIVMARKSRRQMWVYEDPKVGLTISEEPPKKFNSIECWPGGRTVFRPARGNR